MFKEIIEKIYVRLRGKIKGDIHVRHELETDNLNVFIANSLHHTHIITITNFSDRLNMGMTVSQLSKLICQRYKDFILNQIFW